MVYKHLDRNTIGLTRGVDEAGDVAVVTRVYRTNCLVVVVYRVYTLKCCI